MKRKILLLAISLILVSMFVRCKKDETSTTSKPSITTSKDTLYYVQYDGKKYQMDNAHIFYSPLFSSSGSYCFYVYIVSKTVTFNENFNYFTGIGDGLMLNIISPSYSDYSGIFAIDTLDNIVEPGDLISEFYMNSHFSAIVTSGITDPIARGSFSISKITSDTVLVTGSCKTNKNKILKLYYKGVMPRTEVNY